MPVTIHFRGVGLIVANKKRTRVTEVLFPRADEAPPEGTYGEITDPKTGSVKRGWKHADGSVANSHYAGAMVLNSSETFRPPVADRRVRLKAHSGGGADFEPKGLELPDLDRIISKRDKKLKLGKGRASTEVATIFEIPAGTVKPTRRSNYEWAFVEPKTGEDGPRCYCLETAWTIDEPSVVFETTDLFGNDVEEFEADNEVYFYNFDRVDPTLEQLTRPEKNVNESLFDDDFKWIYKLMKHKARDWSDWLESGSFPAPYLDGYGVVSVSTCFEALWAGEKEG
jgi:hypothetical protein